MLQSLYTAVAGMKAQQYNIDIIGNNAANINTMAFQSSRVDFADALYGQMKRPVESGDYLQQGSGMVVGALNRIQLQGGYIASGSTLDFLVDGPGYFTLAGPDGQLYFTRNGSFKVSMENGTGYLVTSDGFHVLGSDNRPIRLPGDALGLGADSEGNLFMNGTAFASLKITTFANPAGLMDFGGSKFQATDAAGAAVAGTATVRQGWLEGSNVDLVLEMARLVRAQKAYSVLGTAVRTADEMESLANNISK